MGGLIQIADVDIDPKGVFKYILIKCVEKSSKAEKLVVRGYYRCNFHADILDETRTATPSDFTLKCIGGGRIQHNDLDKNILVYGYSQGYGRADHQITVDILKRKYPDYCITFSNDGY
ncbi:unnamed protein product [Caenorhabditis angaria]|uniref:Sex-regulated protein janus-B n=1 Tax=Caenorhabditis angaria TaxID=860376 RepID=A0A9P1I8Y4_9PELO|nr:unnamed protein product [Caenorhabditis angaria]